jgi:hypothetical protein
MKTGLVSALHALEEVQLAGRLHSKDIHLGSKLRLGLGENSGRIMLGGPHPVAQEVGPMGWIVLALMALVPALTGCGSAHLAMMTSGPPVALLKTPDGTELVAGACDTSLSSTCERIEKTDNSADEAAWRYVAKVKVQGGFGQPYGEASIPIYVLGPIEKCQAMVAKVAKVPEDRGRTCDGPFYFKRG